MNLAEFLLARIAEDEERGRSLVAQWSDVGNACQSCGTDGVRVLTECEAKRRIVELAKGPLQEVAWIASGSDLTDTGDADAPVRLLRLLALPYADHPDYRSEWAP